jgi:hypothetical protein
MRGLEERPTPANNCIGTPEDNRMHCKKCNAAMNKQVAQQSFHQIRHLYRLQGMAPEIVEELTKRHGPMCEKCLDEWRKEQANTKK